MRLKYARAQSKLSDIETALRLIDVARRYGAEGSVPCGWQKSSDAQDQSGAGGELHHGQNIFPVKLRCIHGGRAVTRRKRSLAEI